MRMTAILLVPLCLMLIGGCAPAVIGGATVGGYKATTDERTLGKMVDDTTLSSRVKTALLRDKSVPGMKIDVDVLEARVTLTGVVKTHAQAQGAVATAGSVEGVRSVRNNLSVGTTSIGQHADDTVIFSKIKTALIGEKGIRSLNIDVDVNKGRVTLTGIVKTEAQRRKVKAVAAKTRGVVSVVDNLSVRP